MSGGLAFMGALGAPSHYLAINAGALVAALALVQFAPRLDIDARIAAAVFVALLFLPFLTGPEVNEVRRWIDLGPVALNAALFAAPPLAVAAARSDNPAAIVAAIAALAAAVAQPDASLGIAVAGAAIGIALARRDTRPALIAIAGVVVAIWAQKRGVLAPQPFVERVYLDAASASPLWLILLLAASVAAIVLIARDRSLGRTERYALAGTLAGFFYTASFADFPAPLIGYGAAPILGIGLALWLARAAPAEGLHPHPSRAIGRG